MRRCCRRQWSASVASQYRIDVLHHADQPGAALILVRLALKIFSNSRSDLVGEAGPWRGLEQRQVVELVVLVIEHDIAVHLRMDSQPFKNFLRARLFGEVRRYVNERYPVMLRGKYAYRIIAPRRCKHDRGTGFAQQLLKSSEQRLVDDVRKTTRVRRLSTIKNSINIQENDLHGVFSICDSPAGSSCSTKRCGRCVGNSQPHR